MSKCIVTGGAGFIGSNLVDLLINLGHHVTVVDNFSTGKYENVHEEAVVYKASIHQCGVEELYAVFADHEFVFHMASWPAVQDSITNPLQNNDINVTGTLTTLLAAKHAGVRRVVYSASSSCYGNAEEVPTTEDSSTSPLSPYALQKMIGEQYCKLFTTIYGLLTVCLRYFNVYGPRMNNEGAYRLVFPIWKEAIENEKPIPITNDGNQTRDFVHVQDVARANVLAAFSPNVGSGEIINIGSGKETSINELADMFDVPVTFIGKRIEPMRMCAGIDYAQTALRWHPEMELATWVEKYAQNVKQVERR